MTPGLTFKIQDDYTILVYDNTEFETPLPGDVNYMNLTIRSTYIPATVGPLDIIEYLTTSRETTEIYKITSEVLGISEYSRRM